MFRQAIACTALAYILSGCATARTPIQTAAALGKVVVYRNGVAYFERRAVVRDGELRLGVPVDRVDDFLKSLRVVDARTGESLPVSFKTMAPSSDETEMVISVPGKDARELLVSYVTDSPAWKPSYRVVLGKSAGQAQLEAWAVVDNVSGEDWRRVTVGVGSTSALSFKYDLHSVRVVERETLGDEEALAHAPPMGGSPYAVASTEIPVVAELDQGFVDRLLEPGKVVMAEEAHARLASARKASGRRSGGATKGKRVAASAAAAEPSESPDEGSGAGRGFGTDDAALDRLALQIKNQAGKVKLEGFAHPKDENREDAALQRANAVRDRLIARGVPADKVDVGALGKLSVSQAVRVVSTADSGAPQQAQSGAESRKDPIGDAYFVASVPMTIEKDRSAMVNLLKSGAKAERVYYYDPVSARGSKGFAFQAIRLENPSDYTLDRGPFTVYAEGQFLGEGLSEAIPAKSTAFIPFALDRQLVVEPVESGREEIDRLVTMDRGLITAQVRSIRTTTFSLHNRGDHEAKVYVRHAVPPGWELRPTKLAMERLLGTYLFPVTVPARSAVEVSVEEAQPLEQTIDLRTTAGVASVGLYLKHSKDLPPKLRAQLEEVLGLYREMADVEQKLSTLGQQMNEYRTRVDEINVQLVSLRRVKTAQELSRHLARKMQEISERLQSATIRSADLSEDLMTRRIRVQDRLAEMTLRPDEGTPDRVATASGG